MKSIDAIFYKEKCKTGKNKKEIEKRNEVKKLGEDWDIQRVSCSLRAAGNLVAT